MSATGICGHTQPGRGLSDSWVTPRDIPEKLGEFDLDPCECTPQPWRHAARGFNVSADGLRSEWTGRVWLNPPYSNWSAWVERLANHGSGTALLFARTETADFVRIVWGRAHSILFLWGRLRFHAPDGTRAKGNAGGPSCLVAYSARDSIQLAASGIPGSFVALQLGAACVAAGPSPPIGN